MRHAEKEVEQLQKQIEHERKEHSKLVEHERHEKSKLLQDLQDSNRREAKACVEIAVEEIREMPDCGGSRGHGAPGRRR